MSHVVRKSYPLTWALSDRRSKIVPSLWMVHCPVVTNVLNSTTELEQISILAPAHIKGTTLLRGHGPGFQDRDLQTGGLLAFIQDNQVTNRLDSAEYKTTHMI
jgi:hypothetical protein